MKFYDSRKGDKWTRWIISVYYYEVDNRKYAINWLPYYQLLVAILIIKLMKGLNWILSNKYPWEALCILIIPEILSFPSDEWLTYCWNVCIVVSFVTVTMYYASLSHCKRWMKIKSFPVSALDSIALELITSWIAQDQDFIRCSKVQRHSEEELAIGRKFDVCFVQWKKTQNPLLRHSQSNLFKHRTNRTLCGFNCEAHGPYGIALGARNNF